MKKINDNAACENCGAPLKGTSCSRCGEARGGTASDPRRNEKQKNDPRRKFEGSQPNTRRRPV